MMEEEKELSPDLRALLDVERASPDLPAARIEAIRTGMVAALAPGKPPPPSTARSLAGKAFLVLAGGIAGAAIHAAVTAPSRSMMSPPPPPSLVVSAAPERAPPTAPIVVRDPSSVPASVPVPVPASVPVPVPVPVPSAAAPSPSAVSTTLAEERALVERARVAVARRDGLSALEALREHSRRFPSPQLAEEHAAIEVEALSITGRVDDAKRKAEAFDRAFPNSIFRTKVDAIVAPR